MRLNLKLYLKAYYGFFFQQGIENLEIEGDSFIVNALRKKSIPNWRIKALLEKAIHSRRPFKTLTINSIDKEGNGKANELLNKKVDGIIILPKILTS